MSHNLYALLSSRFDQHRDRPFLISPTDGGPTLTYTDVDHRSAAIATALRQAGAQPGDRLVAQVDKSHDAVALYLACLRSGLVYVPLNTAYTAEEVGFFIGDAEATVFVFGTDREAKLRPVADLAGIPILYSLGADGDGSLAKAADDVVTHDAVEHDIIEREPDDLACMLYTSGTTGRSKGAMLTHANLASNGLALHRIWGWREGDVLLHTLPIFHVHGLFVALHCAVLNASPVIFCSRFDAAEVRANLARATVLMGVPTHYSRLLGDAEFGPSDCESIRLFTSGSAPLTPEVFKAFTTRTGHTICERYGMTETGILTSNPPEGKRIAGTVGYALPGVALRVVDETDTERGPDEIGSVQVKGPNVFPGYWRLPDKTAEEMTADGYFRTGDIGSLSTDGRLSLVGRSSDMIISGGYNVYPKEIELLLDAVDGVTETAVVGVPHPDFGEGVVAFVVADDGAVIAGEQLDASLTDRVARFKQPKHYVFMDELPRNAMGKVQKSILRADNAELFTD
ncbi:MAG: AMP-binding protein [Actinomycetota bacterium]